MELVLYGTFKICKIWVCRCSLQTLPLIYLSHCTCKFGLILNVLYDLVSRDVTLSTVIFLERKHERNRVIEANLQNLHIIVQLQIKGHDSTLPSRTLLISKDLPPVA